MCPSCRFMHQVSHEIKGRLARCRKCGTSFRLEECAQSTPQTLSQQQKPKGYRRPRRLTFNTSREAEELACNWMKCLGFGDAEVTPMGRDEGIDIVSSSAVAQVKAFTDNNVGAPMLQQFVGASYTLRKHHKVYFAWGDYSQSAISYAEKTGLALFTLVQNKNIKPITSKAKTLWNIAQGNSNKTLRHLRRASPEEIKQHLFCKLSLIGRFIGLSC